MLSLHTSTGWSTITMKFKEKGEYEFRLQVPESQLSYLGTNRIFTTYWLFFPSVYNFTVFWGAMLNFFQNVHKMQQLNRLKLAVWTPNWDLPGSSAFRRLCSTTFLRCWEKGAPTPTPSNPDACLSFHRYFIFPEGPSYPSPEAQYLQFRQNEHHLAVLEHKSNVRNAK